ncbi:zinc finger-containing ubiquitin peptidase 1, partial [Bombina bombina]|uniref:zinc finger-containing ubiquitin peptidase 1 n=1 Tax=Bombina bombina TaxID=8345 RepID=UPI00235AF66C
MLVCDICTQEVASEADMKSHLQLEHIEQEASCPVCTIGGLTYDELNLHMLTAHVDIDGSLDADHVNSKPYCISTKGIYDSSNSGKCADPPSDCRRQYLLMDKGTPNNQHSGFVQSDGIVRDPHCVNISDKTNLCFNAASSCFSSGLSRDSCGQSSSQNQYNNCEPSPCEIGTLLDCPFCCEVQISVEALEEHVQTEHTELLETPTKDTQRQFECPMCSLICANCKILEEHVNLHLEENPYNEVASSKSSVDLNLAIQLQEEEDKRRRVEESQREEEEFKKLQRQFGLDNSGGYKQQSLQNMEKAVARGRMQPIDFHIQKAQMMESLATGIDDGRTKTSGVLEALLRYYRSNAAEVNRVWLSSPLDHFSASTGDKGWGCGFRNIQMLLSSLLLDDTYKSQLQECRSVPCIPKLQSMIEGAWKEGFDPQGASHFNGKLRGTKAWIGACEVYCLLTSLHLKCRILDFHKPSSSSGTHPFLFDWVLNYYSSDTHGGKIVCTSKPAIYLQHQGHSRTIVGLEERKNKTYCLLIFDPGCPPENMQRLLKQNIDSA